MKIDKPTAIGIMNALRAGTVPSHGLEYFAVGLEREMEVLSEQMDWVAGGHSAFTFTTAVYS